MIKKILLLIGINNFLIGEEFYQYHGENFKKRKNPPRIVQQPQTNSKFFYLVVSVSGVLGFSFLVKLIYDALPSKGSSGSNNGSNSTTGGSSGSPNSSTAAPSGGAPTTGAPATTTSTTTIPSAGASTTAASATGIQSTGAGSKGASSTGSPATSTSTTTIPSAGASTTAAPATAIQSKGAGAKGAAAIGAPAPLIPIPGSSGDASSKTGPMISGIGNPSIGSPLSAGAPLLPSNVGGLPGVHVSSKPDPMISAKGAPAGDLGKNLSTGTSAKGIPAPLIPIPGSSGDASSKTGPMISEIGNPLIGAGAPLLPSNMGGLPGVNASSKPQPIIIGKGGPVQPEIKVDGAGVSSLDDENSQIDKEEFIKKYYQSFFKLFNTTSSMEKYGYIFKKCTNGIINIQKDENEAKNSLIMITDGQISFYFDYDPIMYFTKEKMLFYKKKIDKFKSHQNIDEKFQNLINNLNQKAHTAKNNYVENEQLVLHELKKFFDDIYKIFSK